MKKTLAWIILSSIILGGLSGWVFIRFVIPKLNTINWLVKYNLAPQAGPLVINTREEVHFDEGTDSVAAIQKAKPWVVGIIKDASSGAQLKGSGLLLTSDGLIATTKELVSDPNATIQVSFTDGSVLPANLKALDPGSDLAFIKVDGNNFPTASLGYPKDLQLGQRIIALAAAPGQYQDTTVIGYLSSEMRSIDYSGVFSSEQITRTIGVGGIGSSVPGSLMISLDGTAEGILGQKQIISADAIRSALSVYFKNGKIQRNYLGIYYQNISKAESNLMQSHEGVVIKKPDPKTAAVIAQSPAQVAGLLEGDLIYAVDGTQINFDNSFEELLAEHIPGDVATFSLVRAGTETSVKVAIGTK